MAENPVSQNFWPGLRNCYKPTNEKGARSNLASVRNHLFTHCTSCCVPCSYLNFRCNLAFIQFLPKSIRLAAKFDKFGRDLAER